MNMRSKDSSERNYQKKFVAELEKYKWDAPSFLNGNDRKVTVDDLVNFWREELNRINADQLEGVALTDNEFSQVMMRVNSISNSYEAAKMLSIESGRGKIDGIYRDDNPKITKRQITLTIFKKADVRGGDSTYRIAREVSTNNGNRFDIILLINGLPLINIEQKRTDKTLEEAFSQFKRYYREGEFVNNFMAFSQMMVLNSEIETCYFATPKSIEHFNQSFIFHWADKNNKPINSWREVIQMFLMVPMAHQMVGDYLIINEANNEEDRCHMLMRPYQVHALQSVELAAFGMDNEDRIPHGGFVWHTTGSGKTITSFKTSQFLATRAGFDKVIFLVDRKELDKNTSERFKAYSVYELVDVDDTKYTSDLRKKLKSQNTGILVTTTFKLNNLVKEFIEQRDLTTANKRFIFIIDEAHRTTMGQMMGTIKGYFKNNSLFYGFTGTPLFEESKVKGKVNQKSEVINTTEKLFGPLLHKYTIDEGIADGNVLGFHVDYINTGEFISYEDLREKIAERIRIQKPQLSDKDLYRLVASMSEIEVEKYAVKEDILKYQDKTHIPRVVEEIIDNWEAQSQGKEFNAILTVAYRSRVISYYNEFKRQLLGSDYNINIAMTFSFGREEGTDSIESEVINEMFDDYFRVTGIKFSYGDKKNGEDAYFDDVINRALRGGSGRNEKNIDLIIVAEQLLTGYDSKRLNTLYVDRSLELHSLIQAYSRTNRVFGNTKEFGTIVCFQLPRITEEIVNRALELYGSGGSNRRAIVDDYRTAVSKLNICIADMLCTLQNPTDWQELLFKQEESNRFIISFKDAASQLNRVQQYYEFVWDDDTFGIDEHRWLQYVGAYKNLVSSPFKDENDGFVYPLPGKTKLVKTQVIDAAHILALIKGKVQFIDGKQTVDKETIRIINEQIQELSNLGEHEQAMLLKEFVEEELLANKIPSSQNFDDTYEKWKNNQLNLKIAQYADENGINVDLLTKAIAQYSLSKPNLIPYIDEIAENANFRIALLPKGNNNIEHCIKVIEELPNWMVSIKAKYC